MLFDSFKKRIGNLIAINLATVIVITNPKTKAYELLTGKHVNVMWVCSISFSYIVTSSIIFILTK